MHKETVITVKADVMSLVWEGRGGGEEEEEVRWGGGGGAGSQIRCLPPEGSRHFHPRDENSFLQGSVGLWQGAGLTRPRERFENPNVCFGWFALPERVLASAGICVDMHLIKAWRWAAGTLNTFSFPGPPFSTSGCSSAFTVTAACYLSHVHHIKHTGDIKY